MTGPLETETEKYQKARAELLEAEIALRDQCERVAALRRKLPLETEVQDYVREEGPAELQKDGPFTKVRLSELFAPRQAACGLSIHVRRSPEEALPNVYPVDRRFQWRRSPPPPTREFCHHRGGRHRRPAPVGRLLLVSSAGASFKTDLGFQDTDGAQHPGVSVFVQSADGSVKHFYSRSIPGSAIMKEGLNRGIDLLSPVWNIFDLTPGGRGDWSAKLVYD